MNCVKLKKYLIFILINSPMTSFGQMNQPVDAIEALPEHLIYLYSVNAGGSPSKALGQLVTGDKKWEAGRTLKVCLFGGNAVIATLIRQAAGEWNVYSGVKLDFGVKDDWYDCSSQKDGYFQIRIGFRSPGYWSLIGNDSETKIDSYVPSMNLQGFNRIYSLEKMKISSVMSQADPYHIFVVRHEFGHALGLLHEHQNPALKCQDEIKWEGSGNVYDYFGGEPNLWDKEQVQINLGFIGKTDPSFIVGDSDPKSIMMYSLPAAIFKKGISSPCFVSVNYNISEKDKKIISSVYPLKTGNKKLGSDVDLKAATVKPLGFFASPVEISDNIERILVDIESDDVYVRRNARARLSDLIGKIPQEDAFDIIKKSSSGSYRYQLGVAVAVAKAPRDFRLNADARSFLAGRAKVVKDATLRIQIMSAINRYHPI